MSTELFVKPLFTPNTSGSKLIRAGTTLFPLAGGKGWTGKLPPTANLGVGLFLLGYRFILVDGDWGGANLHLFFNRIAPSRSMINFLLKEVKSLRDIALTNPPLSDLRLICGGNEMTVLANLSSGLKEKNLRHITKLEADFVLLDLGVGTAFNKLDLFFTGLGTVLKLKSALGLMGLVG